MQDVVVKTDGKLVEVKEDGIAVLVVGMVVRMEENRVERYVVVLVVVDKVMYVDVHMDGAAVVAVMGWKDMLLLLIVSQILASMKLVFHPKFTKIINY